MSRYVGSANYAHDNIPRLGVLITNLGTPDAPTAPALRRYLAEFLSDPRVVEAPRWLWWLVLHGIILRFRPRRAAAAYAKVWSAEGSPLLVHSRRQASALQSALDERFAGPVTVALGMRYGTPSISAALEELRQANAQRILVLPLYPQYSASTTASTFDALADVLASWRWLPQLRFVTHYHDEPAYVDALAESIRAHRAAHGATDKLLFSFHGLPKRYLLQGDPYFCQCHKTARLVAERLELADGAWQVVFQSRFGREEWLKPYADHTLARLPKEGVGSVEVICPGFSADCLETLEEMAEQNRDVFLNAGGKTYHYIPALNDSPTHIAMLANLIAEHCQGWPEASSTWDSDKVQTAANRSRERALAHGASR